MKSYTLQEINFIVEQIESGNIGIDRGHDFVKAIYELHFRYRSITPEQAYQYVREGIEDDGIDFSLEIRDALKLIT